MAKILRSINAEQDGKVVTHLSLPYSVDRSPYFQIKIPICHIRNGDGPAGSADGRQSWGRI